MIKTGIRGRPTFYIPREQLEHFIEYGFKATEISKMLCMGDKTVDRRLEEYGISMRMNFTQITEPELDNVIRTFYGSFLTRVTNHYVVISWLGDGKYKNVD